MAEEEEEGLEALAHLRFSLEDREDYENWRENFYEEHKDEESEYSPSGLKDKVTWYWRQAGFSALATGSAVGPGTMGTILVGATVYYDKLLWAVLVASLFYMVAIVAISRMTMGSGKSLFHLFKEIHPAYRWLIIALNTIAMFFVVAFEGSAISAVPYLFTGIDTRILVFPMAIGMTLLYLAKGNHRTVIRVTWALLLLLLICYIATLGIVWYRGAIPWAGIASGLIPSGGGTGYMEAVAGLLGGSCAIYLIPMTYSIIEEKQHVKKYLPFSIHEGFWNAILIYGGYSILLFLVVSAVFPGELVPAGAIDAAKSLGPLAGPSAKYLFALGFFGVALTTAAGCAMLWTFPVVDAIGLPPSLRNKTSWMVFVAVMLVIPITGPYMGHDLLQFGKMAMSLMTPFMVPVIPGMLYVLNKKKFVGEHTNGPIMNIIMIIWLAVMSWAGYGALESTARFLLGGLGINI